MKSISASSLSFLLLISYINCYETNFIQDMPRMLTQNVNITTYAGETVKLPCELSNLGNYHVNWLKIHNSLPMALTVGYQQFSRNMRYRVVRDHNEIHNIDSWNFEIRKLAHSDSGLYECYVKLSPRHKLRAYINLEVKDKKVFTKTPISERLSYKNVENVKISPNSWVKLRCNATSVPSKISSKAELQWFKNGKAIEQDSRRLKKWVASYENSNYMELDLFAVNPDDSGNYQCKRDDTVLKSVYIEVNKCSVLISQDKLILLIVSFLFSIIYY